MTCEDEMGEKCPDKQFDIVLENNVPLCSSPTDHLCIYVGKPFIKEMSVQCSDADGHDFTISADGGTNGVAYGVSFDSITNALLGTPTAAGLVANGIPDTWTFLADDGVEYLTPLPHP